jgi:hypothetical protein
MRDDVPNDVGRGMLAAGGDPAVADSLAGVVEISLFDFEQSGELGGGDDAGPLAKSMSPSGLMPLPVGNSGRGLCGWELENSRGSAMMR